MNRLHNNSILFCMLSFAVLIFSPLLSSASAVSVDEEVIIGARCRMSTGGKNMETITDDYGDFWFNDLAIGRYELAIEAHGYEGKYFKDLYTDK